MDAEERFRQLVQVASALQAARRWEQAGRAWIDAARVAIDAAEMPSARVALDAAGEAFRRDDRLDEARKALNMVLDLKPTADEASLARIRLAGIAGEIGKAEEGLAACRGVSAGSRALLAMAVDTEIGLLWQVGRKALIRERVVRLLELEGSQGFAVRFRQAQLARTDGELAQAEERFLALSEELRGKEGSDAGIAAIRAEIAENHLLRGDCAAALEGFDRARELHEASGRRGLAFRAEGGRVRAAVAAGLDILDAPLDEGLAYASDRNLHALALELRIALGMLLAARGQPQGAEVLRAAIHTALASGSRLSAGRARLELATRGCLSPEARRGELSIALAELEDHTPLRQRAASEMEC